MLLVDSVTPPRMTMKMTPPKRMVIRLPAMRFWTCGRLAGVILYSPHVTKADKMRMHSSRIRINPKDTLAMAFFGESR